MKENLPIIRCAALAGLTFSSKMACERELASLAPVLPELRMAFPLSITLITSTANSPTPAEFNRPVISFLLLRRMTKAPMPSFMKTS